MCRIYDFMSTKIGIQKRLGGSQAPFSAIPTCGEEQKKKLSKLD